MAKPQKRLGAIELRKSGHSIKEITKKLQVSRASVSRWCREVELTQGQIAVLNNNRKQGGMKGGIRSGLAQKKKRRERIAISINEGKQIIGNFSKRDCLMVGLGLYLGEGSKGREFQFSNSNPDIIKLIVIWLAKIINISKKELILRIYINKIHEHREKTVKKFWLDLLNVPKNQFRKTVFIKTKNKKIYDNYHNYFGVMAIKVRKSSAVQNKINGLIYHINKSINSHKAA